jgi:hypothetical protein
MLRGPVLGRVVPGGQFFRAAKAEPNRLGEVLGADEGFEPLFVQEVAAQDELVFYWSACVLGTSPLPSDVVVTTTVWDAAGTKAKELETVPLTLTDRGKKISCADKLATIPGGSLPAGDYRLEVTVRHPNGELIAKGSEPLTVR